MMRMGVRNRFQKRPSRFENSRKPRGKAMPETCHFHESVPKTRGKRGSPGSFFAGVWAHGGGFAMFGWLFFATRV